MQLMLPAGSHHNPNSSLISVPKWIVLHGQLKPHKYKQHCFRALHMGTFEKRYMNTSMMRSN